MLPLAFKLEGAPALVVGAGRVGCFKASQLLDAGARVTVIAEHVLAEPPTGLESLERRPYRHGDLAGYRLVVSATGRADVNDAIVEEAGAAGIWLNVVDDPARSDFYFMALHRRGSVTVAVTSEGASPALAQELRDLVARSLPEGLDDAAATLREERRRLHEAGSSTEGHDWRPRVRELLGLDPGDGAAGDASRRAAANASKDGRST